MSIGGLNHASCGNDFSWGNCGGGGHGSKAHGSKSHGSKSHGGSRSHGTKAHGSARHGSGGHGSTCNPFPQPPVNCNPFPQPPVNCNPFPQPPVVCNPFPQPPVVCNPFPQPPVCPPVQQPPVCPPVPQPPTNCGHNTPGIGTVDWGGAHFVDACHQPGINLVNWGGANFVNLSNQPGIQLVNWGGAAFVNLGNCGTGGNVGGCLPPPPPCIAPPSVCNGTLTFGDNKFDFSGDTVHMTNTCTGEKTCVWGDPHITSPNGNVSTVDGNFTFNLGDGTKVTIITSNGVQNSGLQQGCVGNNSVATQVVVTNGQYTATMKPDGCIAISCGNNDPVDQQGLQLVEVCQQWTHQPIAMA